MTRRRPWRAAPLWPLAALALLAAPLAACSAVAGGGSEPTGDALFGHRYSGIAPDGRETMVIAEADTARRVLIYPAVLDSIAVRPERPATLPGDPVRVEVLLKGVVPGACSRLESAEQVRRGNFVEVVLSTRQPRGRPCAQVLRPFRFYLPLEGTYEPGSYTLTANGAVVPFRIRALRPES